MKIIVENQEEAVEVARTLVRICNEIAHPSMDSILQTSYEGFLCQLRDSIEVKDVQA